MSAIVDFKISQHAVKQYADEVRNLEKQLKAKEIIIKELRRKLSVLYNEISELDLETKELLKTDYGPPYGPHNPTGNKGVSK